MIQSIAFESVIDQLIQNILIVEGYISFFAENFSGLICFVEFSLQTQIFKIELTSFQNIDDDRPACLRHKRILSILDEGEHLLKHSNQYFLIVNERLIFV